MSETEGSPAKPTPLTEEEFEEFMEADETILELSLNDFIPTLYSYKQAKQLLLRFHLPFTRGMRKERMMSDLLNLCTTTQLATATVAASTDAASNPTDLHEDAEEEIIAARTAEQVEASNIEEELLHPSTTDVHQTKTDHGAEIAELDAKIHQLEKEMCSDIERVSTAKVLEFKETDFTEGLTNVNLRITKNELQLKSVTESLDKRFPSNESDSFTSLLIPPIAPDEETPVPTAAMSTKNKHRGELFYGYEHKDGRRTCSLARKEVEDDRLRRSGFIMVHYSYSHDEILQWMILSLKPPPEQAFPANLRGGVSDSGGVALNLTEATPIDQGTSQQQPAAPMLSTKLASNIAAAYEEGQAKRDELRRQYELGSASAHRTLEFEGEVDNDTAGSPKNSIADNIHAGNALNNQQRGVNTRMNLFRSDSDGLFRHQQAVDKSSFSDDSTQFHTNTTGVQHSTKKDLANNGTPIQLPANPYNTGQMPLTDKYLGQCNDFYLRGPLGLLSADDFAEDYYCLWLSSIHVHPHLICISGAF